MLAAVLLEHTLVRLSGEDTIFMGMLPEHALVPVESGNDAMLAGSGDVMLAGMLLENALVHILSGEDAMFAGVLSEHALFHVEISDDVMFAGGDDAMRAAERGALPVRERRHCDVLLRPLDDAMLAGMLLENPFVHIVSGEDAMHVLVTDQGMLIENS